MVAKQQDEKITKMEILANWNMFVGSQATNYGEDLTKKHDELWFIFYYVDYSYNVFRVGVKWGGTFWLWFIL